MAGVDDSTAESSQLSIGHAGSATLLKRNETETPHEHVAGDIGSGETTPARTVRPPMVDHCVRRGLRNYAGVRGHQHAVNVELD